MIVLFLLLHDARLQILKVGHYVRVDNFYILVVLRRQVVLHEPDLLPQQLDLLLVLAQRQLRLADPLLHAPYLPLDALFAWDGDFGAICAQGLIIGARGGDAAPHGSVTCRCGVRCGHHFNLIRRRNY